MCQCLPTASFYLLLTATVGDNIIMLQAKQHMAKRPISNVKYFVIDVQILWIVFPHKYFFSLDN